MKHATAVTFSRLSALLDNIRELPGLTEKKDGVFYRKSRAFLHFHEHGEEIYADLRLTGAEFDRHACATQKDQSALVNLIRKGLGIS